MSEQLKPLSEPLQPEAAELLKSYPRVEGYLLSLFRTFANSPRFVRKGVANLLDPDSPLPVRQREIVILRTTANRDCEYEWGVHVQVFAEHVGFTQEQVRATRLSDPDTACWTDPDERLLLRVVDELTGTATLSDETLAGFQARWDLAQQLEVLALCGNYTTISLVANVARLPAEAFAARFPVAS